MRTRLLIVSFSPIVSDARVLKQVRLFGGDDRYELTTLGYGPAPQGVDHHIQIPDELVSWCLDHAALILHRFEQVQAHQEVAAWARGHLEPGTFDVVLADDVETVPLALWLQPAGGVHADLHEYAPRQKESVWRWRTFVAPYQRWLCRRYVARAESVTTVAPGLAQAYRREYGIDAAVVTNAAPYREAEPQPVGETIRLVHSGAALPDRHLELMVEAMSQVDIPVTLDLYLTPNDAAVIEDLRRRADALPTGRVRVLDPVPYAQLIETLAGYDVGVFNLPPVSFNYLHALPNKLFDFVQARLASLVSPNPEMAGLVRDYELGWVTDGYRAQDFARAINALTPAAIAQAKAAAHRHAHELSAQEAVGEWAASVERLADRARKVSHS